MVGRSTRAPPLCLVNPAHRSTLTPLQPLRHSITPLHRYLPPTNPPTPPCRAWEVEPKLVTKVRGEEQGCTASNAIAGECCYCCGMFSLAGGWARTEEGWEASVSGCHLVVTWSGRRPEWAATPATPSPAYCLRLASAHALRWAGRVGA